MAASKTTSSDFSPSIINQDLYNAIEPGELLTQSDYQEIWTLCRNGIIEILPDLQELDSYKKYVADNQEKPLSVVLSQAEHFAFRIVEAIKILETKMNEAIAIATAAAAAATSGTSV